MNKRSLVTAFIAAVGLSVNASAALLFTEGFNYSGALNGKTGGTGFGTNPWSVDSTFTALMNASATGLSYNIPGGGVYSTTHSVKVSGSGTAGLVTAASRTFAAPITASTVYFSMLIQAAPGTILNTGDVFGISIGGTTGNPDAQLLSFQRSSDSNNSTFSIQARTEGSTNAIAGDFAVGETLMVVFSLSKGAGTTYDHLSLWVNPSLNSSGTPDDTITSNTAVKVTSLSQIGFRASNLETSDHFLVGGIRAGETWSDVVSIPEPGSGLLILSGIAGIVALRSLKKRG